MALSHENTELRYRFGSTKPGDHFSRTAARYCEIATWINYYLCSCGEEWIDRWSACCNDRCPKCNKEIEPFLSDDGTRFQEEIEAAYAKISLQVFNRT